MERILNSLAADEEVLSVEVDQQLHFVSFRVTAPKASIARFIGPKGQTARALRTLLAAQGAALRRRYALDLDAR